MEYVNKVLRMYDQQYGKNYFHWIGNEVVMYKWVHMRKVANKSIPTTMTEMRDMMSRDHTGISMKDIMKLNPQQSKYRSTRQKVRM